MLDNIIYFIDSISAFFRPKYRYYKDHRDTELYKKKKELVKGVWIVAGLVMAILAQLPHYLPLVIIIALFTTILAFVILDETYYPDE